MKNLIRIISLALILPSVSALAVPTGFTDSLDLGPEVEFSSDAEIKGCTDFRGTWKGKCTVASKEKEESFTIDQKECDMIQVTSSRGTLKLSVGGAYTLTGATVGTPGKTFGGSLCSHWNKDRSVLNVGIHGGKKLLAADDEGKGLAIKEQISMNAGKLNVTLTGTSGEEKFLGSCAFEKQN
jgi:hypothetical protein